MLTSWFYRAVLFFLALSASLAPEYTLLGIPIGSDFETVKSAYRREALKWHPDRNSDPQAQDRFIRISEAYERLKEVLTQSTTVESAEGHPINAFEVFRTFMGGFSFGVSGTSQSSSTVIQNGKRITRTVVTDLASGRSETTITEEDLSTGNRRVTEL